MDNPIIERDVVLIGKTEEGNDTFDFPITRLGNIEDDAEIKATPESGDYFPVIDNSDGGKMKKTAMDGILAPLNTHIGDNARHITAEERSAWNNKASGDHTHDNRYYTEAETDNKLSKKSDVGHTHLASEISRLPTSLPANGGNSDTVDGKHAADFAASGHTHDDRYYTEAETNAKLAEKADKNHTHSAASQSSDGFMSSADKKKLDGIAAGANIYNHPAYTARTGVPTANQTPSFGGTFSITQPVSDASGHITGMNTKTVKIPDTEASSSKRGLMSVDDKKFLDSVINDGAHVKVTMGACVYQVRHTRKKVIRYRELHQ